MRKNLVDHDAIPGAIDEAGRAGRAAFKGDGYRTDNPYIRGTACWHSWFSSFEKAYIDTEILAIEALRFNLAQAEQKHRFMTYEIAGP